MNSGHWLSRFDELDPSEIRARFHNIPTQIDPRNCIDREGLVSKIRAALASLAVPTAQSVEICHQVVSRAKAHAAAVYPDAKTFLYQCYRKDGPAMPEENFPDCLTGPAGIGKSTLIRRMKSIFPPNTSIAIDTGNRLFPVVAAWYLSAKEFRTVSSMLRHLIAQAGCKPCGKKIEDLARQCRRLAYECGICMIFLDELQFLTKSQGATAKIVDAIYELMGIGVPVTIVANYSLITSLKRRPQQDRQRVLGNTKILYHEPATSADWISLLQGVVNICPDVFRIDPGAHALSLHNLTAGIPRNLSFLVTTALAKSRAATPELTIENLRAAYESPEFSVCREDVEKLNQQLATGARVREDLWPPIRVPLVPQAALQKAAKEQALAETAKKLLEGSLTQGELALLKELKKSHSDGHADDNVVAIGEKAQPKIADFETGESILEKLRNKK